jgi:2-polyprenyl-3-methyl-5-hydroxy-6-metoxy-1,4-benzoquinol methylase
MDVLPFPEFDRIYQETVREVYGHWSPAMQERLAENCRGWAPDVFDFRNYLQASSERFYRAYRRLAELAPGNRVCDVGGFWGVFAVTLRALGFNVTMTESLGYYGDAFDPLFRAIETRGIVVVDYDPFAPDQRLSARFDAVTVMAVIEHYPHSLKPFLDNLKGLLGPSGIVHIGVPNIALLAHAHRAPGWPDAAQRRTHDLRVGGSLRRPSPRVHDGRTTRSRGPRRPRGPSRGLLQLLARGKLGKAAAEAD